MTTTREGLFPLVVRNLKKQEEENDKTEEAVLELDGDTSLQRIWEELEGMLSSPDFSTQGKR
jgi:hypothetical protein